MVATFPVEQLLESTHGFYTVTRSCMERTSMRFDRRGGLTQLRRKDFR